jgi:DNA-binding response OmpR family regulator
MPHRTERFIVTNRKLSHDRSRVTTNVAVVREIASNFSWFRQTKGREMIQDVLPLAKQVVALFNASDDTVDMVQRMLDASGLTCLVGCHFSDLKKGCIDFGRYLSEHDPDVVIFDISPPYRENWAFFKTLRNGTGMEGRGLVLTTTNKERLDETVGKDSEAFEIVGKPYDLDQIQTAIRDALKAAGQAKRCP